MVNVVIPIIDNAAEYQKTLMFLSLNSNVNIIVGVTAELESAINFPKSVIVRVFKNQSKKEEIINSLKEQLAQGKVLIARRPFTKKEFDEILKSSAEITYLKEKSKNNFTAFCKRTVGNLIKFLFGVKYFEGDVSLICFDESLCEVLQNVSSLSYVSRVDRWRGVEQNSIDAEGSPVKLEGKKSTKTKLITGAVCCFVIPVIVTVLVACLAKVNFLIGLILACTLLLGIAGASLLSCSYYLNHVTGERYFKDAEEN